MIGLELIGFKLYNFCKIKETEFVHIFKLTTLVGHDEERKKELLSIIKGINTFIKLDEEKISFKKEKEFNNPVIILEFKINKELRDAIYKISHLESINTKEEIKICVTKDDLFNIELFEEDIDFEKDGIRKKIIDLLKRNIPKFEIIDPYEQNTVSDLNKNQKKVLVFNNLEKYCTEKGFSVERYSEDNFGENIVIHVTTPPYIIHDIKIENNIIDMDKRFTKVSSKKQSKEFNKATKLMVIGIILSFLAIICRFLHILSLKEDDIGLFDKVIKSFIHLGCDILKGVVVTLALAIILRLVAKCKYEDYEIFLISPLISVIIIIYYLVAPLTLVVIIFLLTTIIAIGLMILSYQIISKLLLNLVGIMLINLPHIIPNADIDYKEIICRKDFFQYMATLIIVSILPYMIKIARLIVKFMFGFFNKPLLDFSQNFVDKCCNTKITRILLYLIAFFSYFINIVIKFKSNNFELIREGFLTWIIVDVLLFSIFEYINDKNAKNEKKEILRFQKKLSKYFDDSIIDKNKFQMYEIFQKIEEYKIAKKNIKMKKENYIREYYSDFFSLYDWMNIQSVLDFEKYRITLEDLKNIVDSKEIEILSS